MKWNATNQRNMFAMKYDSFDSKTEIKINNISFISSNRLIQNLTIYWNIVNDNRHKNTSSTTSSSLYFNSIRDETKKSKNIAIDFEMNDLSLQYLVIDGFNNVFVFQKDCFKLNWIEMSWNELKCVSFVSNWNEMKCIGKLI